MRPNLDIKSVHFCSLCQIPSVNSLRVFGNFFIYYYFVRKSGRMSATVLKVFPSFNTYVQLIHRKPVQPPLSGNTRFFPVALKNSSVASTSVLWLVFFGSGLSKKARDYVFETSTINVQLWLAGFTGQQ